LVTSSPKVLRSKIFGPRKGPKSPKGLARLGPSGLPSFANSSEARVRPKVELALSSSCKIFDFARATFRLVASIGCYAT
jgi:hypothetical protein